MATDLTLQWDNQAADELAREFRFVITDMICRSGSGHIGGALSLVDIIITLYYRVMRVKPDEPRWLDRDRLVLSKGHAGPVLYTALAYRGFFPIYGTGDQQRLRYYYGGSKFPIHISSTAWYDRVLTDNEILRIIPALTK